MKNELEAIVLDLVNDRVSSPTPSSTAIAERGTSPTPSSTAISVSLAMLSPHSPGPGKLCISLLMSKWHLLNTIDQTEHCIVADDSTPCLQEDNRTSDINPLQGLAAVHSQGTDDNLSLPNEGGKKNKEENKESKKRGGGETRIVEKGNLVQAEVEKG